MSEAEFRAALMASMAGTSAQQSATTVPAAQSTGDQARTCRWCDGITLDLIPIQDYLQQHPDAQCHGCGRGFVDPRETHMRRCPACQGPYHRGCGEVPEAQAAQAQPSLTAGGTAPHQGEQQAPTTTTTTTTTATTRRKVTCTYCFEDIEQDDAGLFTNAIVCCSWDGCQGHIRFLHSACLAENNAPGYCLECKEYMLVPVTSLNDRPQPVPRVFKQRARSTSWQDSHGVVQIDMLCYAAATATACRCAGMPGVTLMECMHLYMTSPGCEASNKEKYISTFERLSIPGDSVDVTLGKMNANFPTTRKDATTSPGVPVFPSTVKKVFSPAMADAELMQAIRSGKVVMAGIGNHWVVIIGYCADNTKIEFIEIFDPANGTTSLETWDAAKYSDFYSVG